MARAAILIGVNKTGGLPELSDAVNGAREMAKWALGQGMDAKNVYLFTDDTGSVEAHTIHAAIRSLVDAGNVEQLFVYFAGHGVNKNYGEYWLLSAAPADGAAAVNVDGSVYRARSSGIPHVIFISDACRSAAQGIQGQGIDGTVVFPNDPVAGPEQAVDMFFATTLGRPALEVRDAGPAGAPYKALYTGAFLDAVYGRIPGCMAVQGSVKVVRPRLLKTCLSTALPQRMAMLDLTATVSQIPDARVTSGDEAWLARFDIEIGSGLPDNAGPADNVEPRPRRGVIVPPPRVGGAPPGSPFPRYASPMDEAAHVIEELLHNDGAPAPTAPSGGPRTWKWGGTIFRRKLPHRLPLLGNEGGIAVEGAEIVRCFVSPSNTVIRSNQYVMMDSPAVDVQITFADGSATLMPVIKGFVTTLRFKDGELADVLFETTRADAPNSAFPSPEPAQDRLRAAVANAARAGIFRLDGANGRLLETHLLQSRMIDPSLALYAAYGFHDQQMLTALVQLDDLLRDQLSFSFFDISLLCKRLAHSSVAPGGYTPLVPLLARGWSMWTADRSPPPEPLIGLQRELLPSLWTHFTATGAERLQAFLSARIS